MERDARIAERVHETARGRLQREVVSPKGDIVTEEIDERDAPQDGAEPGGRLVQAASRDVAAERGTTSGSAGPRKTARPKPRRSRSD